METSRNKLARFAWGVLAYNLLVIAWGAFVRATGSGAGCGKHWPLCNGEPIPTLKSAATAIEASHRVSSGIALVLVVALMVRCIRALPRGDRARRASIFSGVFIFGEALIGAGLVLFELVAHDASMKRGLSMILHLGNTFFLLASLTLTAWWLVREPAQAKAKRSLAGALALLPLAAVMLLAASGAIAALGDTLFPTHSLVEGFREDMSPMAHAFVRLRMWHPFLAVASGIVVIATSAVLRLLRPTPRVRRFSRVATALFVVQFCAGLLNVTLLAPVWMQLVHLFLADATWIALVLTACETIYAEPVSIMSKNGPAPINDVPPSTSNVDPVT